MDWAAALSRWPRRTDRWIEHDAIRCGSISLTRERRWSKQCQTVLTGPWRWSAARSIRLDRLANIKPPPPVRTAVAGPNGATGSTGPKQSTSVGERPTGALPLSRLRPGWRSLSARQARVRPGSRRGLVAAQPVHEAPLGDRVTGCVPLTTICGRHIAEDRFDVGPTARPGRLGTG